MSETDIKDLKTIKRLNIMTQGLDVKDKLRFNKYLRELGSAINGDVSGVKAELETANTWMREHGLCEMFSDITDGERVREDYAYFFGYISPVILADQEHEARREGSPREPLADIKLESGLTQAELDAFNDRMEVLDQ